MKICLSFLGLLLYSFSALAQDYAPILPGKTLYYFNPKEEARAIRIDSVRVSGDWTNYYNYQVIAEDPFDKKCDGLKQFQPGWLGKYISYNKDGSLYFRTKQNEWLYIKTNSNVGDYWSCYVHKDTINNIYINGEASVNEIETGTIYGEPDTFKTIIVDLQGNVSYTRKIILSKHHGLIRFFDLSYFPYTSKDFDVEENDALTSFTQEGQQNPLLGKQLLNGKDLFEFEIGDEFHYKFEFSGYGLGFLDRWIIKRVIDKKYSRHDSIVTYTFNNTTHSRHQEISQYTVSSDTFDHQETHNIYAASPMAALPYERMDTDYMPYFRETLQSFDRDRRTRIHIHENTNPRTPSDTCLGVFIDGGASSTIFVEGLGSTHRSYDDGASYQREYMVYFKKTTGETWGTPIDMYQLVNVSERSIANPELSLYPNPANSSLQISNSGLNTTALQLRLYNTTGQLVLEEKMNGQSSLSIVHLPPGLYAAITTDSEGKFLKQEKLIIQR